jgi:hypothetical protein
MSNTIRKANIKFKNATMRDISAIYKEIWDSYKNDADPILDNIYYDDDDATEDERMEHAEKRGKNELILLGVGYILLANRRAVARINAHIEIIYNSNIDDIGRQVKIENVGRLKIGPLAESIANLLSKHTTKAFDAKINRTLTTQKLTNIVNMMIKKGYTASEMGNALNKMYNINKTSAMRIITTETTRMAAEARMAVMREAKKTGITYEKIWRHSGIAKMPRDWHIELDGTTEKLDEPFVTALGNELMYPGDPAGPAIENVNCHCYLDEKRVDK